MNLRDRVRPLALGAVAMFALVSMGVPTAAQAKPIEPQKTCSIPGSNLKYVPGEKATFSLNGQPAKEHTCQKDGTWTARVAIVEAPIDALSLAAVGVPAVGVPAKTTNW